MLWVYLSVLFGSISPLLLVADRSDSEQVILSIQQHKVSTCEQAAFYSPFLHDWVQELDSFCVSVQILKNKYDGRLVLEADRKWTKMISVSQLCFRILCCEEIHLFY